MLPFLKPRPQVGVIVRERKPDGGSKEQGMEGQDSPGLMACAEDLIRAINSKDARSVMSALKSMFEIMDSEPHEEGPHTNEDSNEESE